MATTPPPSAGASEPRPSTSEAIQTGADVFVAFFEIEMAKATAASKRTIRDLEARFSEFQKSSHSSAVIYTRRCADLEAAIRSTRTAHAQAVAEGSLARTQMSEAQQQLAKVKHGLDHLKNCPKTEHSSCLQFPPEQAGNGATVTPTGMQNCDAEVQADDLNMLFSLGELRRQLMVTQQLLEAKERDCKAVEKERDDLKAAMMINNRIFSVQVELESLKDSHARSQTSSSMDKDMLVGEAAHSVAHDITTLASSALREDGSQKDDTQSSKTLSALPLSCILKNSEHPNFVSVAHTTNGPSAAGRAPSVASSTFSAHTAKHSSLSQAISPSLNPTSGSFAINIQKDDEKSPSKRPASDSINSTLETSAKRVKRDHLPHDQSPVANSPSHQPSDCAINESDIWPAAPGHSSNQPGSEARMKHTGAASVSACHLATSEGNTGHHSPRVSDNQNQAPPSRPKPKPAYSGRPSNSTIAGGTDSGGSKKNATVSEHTPSRPKPGPAYSGANSIHSGSTPSCASGSAD
ncbi:hypothetical protein PILCRDRAFT_810929 [Piloderma croceum F 1598]|uniref:Uncharacterized protein n=1 Tax=Piloderma croceum (strain F 1598) TaxID=765440 RepID=A0A0C3BYM4_PILCF|nr:hypothetical protein PILCRDRAFT_810929 [Piloderma croceum F 1598]